MAHKAATIIFVVCLALQSALVPLSQKKQDTFPAWFPTQFFFEWIALVLISLAVLVPVVGVIKKTTQPAWLIETLENALTASRKYFLDRSLILNDPMHHHRITLFQFKRRCFFPKPFRWCWPWSGWLIPLARSGHVTIVKSNF